MKELTIEQKAERYDEAITKLRSLHDNYDTVSTLIDVKEELENIIPELKESEFEKIRKWIIDDIRYNINNEPLNNSEYRKKAEKAIAWLEKQDDADKEYWRGYREGKKEILDKYSELEKQGEQKSAWSEEDEEIKQSIIDILTKQGFQTQVNWLKSLKDRVQPQQKWSEDDENTISEAEVWLDTLCDYLKDSSSAYIPNVRVVISNLKSLKGKVLPQTNQDWSE